MSRNNGTDFSEAVLPILPNLECGPMPNVTATLPNIVGALGSTLQSLADTDLD